MLTQDEIKEECQGELLVGDLKNTTGMMQANDKNSKVAVTSIKKGIFTKYNIIYK